jgi:two-component system, cell cycle sensor histidine kinase and response regulator CckA
MKESEKEARQLGWITNPRALLEGLFEHAPVAFQIYGANGHCLLVNQAFRDLFGSEPPPEYNVLEDDVLERQGFLELVRRAFAGETIHVPPHWYDPRELRQLEVREGRRVGIAVTLFPLREPDGQVLHVALCIKDVTAELERQQAEAALRESEARYRSIVETTNDGIWLLDRELRTIFANARFASMVGLEPHAIAGAPIQELVHHDSLAAFMGSLQRIEGTATQCEVQLKSQAREELWVLLGSTPVSDSAGQFDGVLLVVMDVTQRKRLEMQLRQLQKMQAVGQLAGGIAHDLNNVLTPILSYTALMLAELERDHAMRQDVREVQRAAQRAAAMVGQLLAFSQQKVVQPQTVDVNARVRSVEKMIRPLIGEHIEVVARLGREPMVVFTDPTEVEQAILNLVLNARDAMPNGGRIVIQTARVELGEEEARKQGAAAAGAYVLLVVSDTGVGMDPETRARIFEPFFTTKSQRSGTGLGLATVYAIVTKYSGGISVESEPGRGTTFRVYFPSHMGRSAASSGEYALGRKTAGSETVLLVEDDEIVLRAIRAVLESQGYNVVAAGDAAQALELSESHPGPIELLLTDVVMPKMGGRELAERLTERRPETKVIFMSGYAADSTLRQRILEAGVPFIQKPFTPDVIALKIREVLDN